MYVKESVSCFANVFILLINISESLGLTHTKDCALLEVTVLALEQLSATLHSTRIKSVPDRDAIDFIGSPFVRSMSRLQR